MAHAKDKNIKDMTASFLAVLDNEDVVVKLAQILSASIQLTLNKKIVSVHQKLDKIIQDNKNLSERLSSIERENAKLKNENDGFQVRLDNLQNKVNQLEQGQLRHDVIVYGVKETYAERADESIRMAILHRVAGKIQWLQLVLYFMRHVVSLWL